jgi:hypothetical protein
MEYLLPHKLEEQSNKIDKNKLFSLKQQEEKWELKNKLFSGIIPPLNSLIFSCSSIQWILLCIISYIKVLLP